MKKRIVSWVVIGIVAIAAIIAIANISYYHKQTTANILSDKYYDKKYIEEINGVELIPNLETIVSEDELFMVKTAVLENNIGPENQERLIPVIEEYGAENTLMGYGFINDKFVTWSKFEELVRTIDLNGIEDAMRTYDAETIRYTPSEFKVSQLDEWFEIKRYPINDINAIDKLSQLYGENFDELLAKYENGKTIEEIKAELGLVNTDFEKGYITIKSSYVELLAEKLGLDKDRAEEVLIELVRLNVDVDKLNNINAKDEYELLASILEQKYGGNI